MKTFNYVDNKMFSTKHRNLFCGNIVDLKFKETIEISIENNASILCG